MEDGIRYDHTLFHHVYIKDRKTVEITGVKKVDSFDALEFLIETSLGYLNIVGSDLALVKFDQDKGEVGIKGNIDSIGYVSNKKKVIQKEKMLGKLLK